MKKEIILKKLDEAVLHEEEAVPIYAEHIATTAYWAGLSKDKIEEIKNHLKVLHKDSIGHAKAFKLVKKMINQK